MRVSKLSLVATLIGTAAWSLVAQPASPEQQRRALELLHQAMAQPGYASTPGAPSPSTTMGVAPAKPAGTTTAAPVVMSPAPSSGMTTVTPTPAPYRGATPEQQERAIQLLRGMTAQQLALPPSPTAPQPANPNKTATTSANSTPNQSANSAKKPAPVTSSSVNTSTPGAPTATTTMPTVQSTGPKTKQQRLNDLLDLYKADKLSPSEYHAQRAKILSEP